MLCDTVTTNTWGLACSLRSAQDRGESDMQRKSLILNHLTALPAYVVENQSLMSFCL